MRFTQAATPYINNKLTYARNRFTLNDNDAGFRVLEDAHVIGQYSTYHHTRVHFEMLKYGLKQRDFKEVSGQILRIIGALTKTAIGFLPEGNTGGANVSPFKPMPISVQNQAILAKIK